MPRIPERGFAVPVFNPLGDKSKGIKSGRSAQESGASLQRDIDAANAHYRAKGLGVVTEIPVPTRHVRGVPGARQLVESKGDPDYVGFLHPIDLMGRLTPIAFDAKVTTGHTSFGASFFSNHKLRATLSKQAQFLIDFARSGGTAGLLCLDREVGEHGAVFWIAAKHLEAFTMPAFIAGFAKPDIPIRTLKGGLATPHRYKLLDPLDRDVVGGRTPLIDYRKLV